MELTILIPFWNGHQHITRLLNSIPKNIPVIVIDDHSDAPLQLDKSNVRVIRPPRKGYFTGAVNSGIKACKTDVLILNQDTWLSGSAALDLIAEKNKTFALIGERITGEHPAFPNHGYIHGTFMYIRRDLIDRVGLLDEKHFPLWGSTADYQLRACRAGFSALPVQKIPGFSHKRGRRNFGSAISELLTKEPDKRGLMIRTPPLISVVINCFNHGRYLSDTINSLIGGPTSLGHMRGQTLQSFEVIIIDDGSTDNTPELAKALANPWKGIRYIRQKNRGSAAAMNRGVSNAYGKYIAPLDADDMMSEARLEQMLAMQEANPHSVICDNMSLFRDGEYLRTAAGEIHEWNMKPYNFEKLIYANTMHKGLFYPKQAWTEAGGYPPAMNRGREDWAFNVALGIKGWCGVMSPNSAYLYRREGQNRTLTNTTPDRRKNFQRQLFGLFPNIYAGERPMGCCGKGAKTVNLKGGAQAPFPGQAGMTLIRYVGGNAGDMSWWGDETGKRYIFGGNRRVGNVDNRDLEGFLNAYKSGQKLFALVPTPPPAPAPAPDQAPPPPPPAVPEPMEDVLTVADLPEIAQVEVKQLDVPDPTTMVIRDFRVILEEQDFSEEELLEMLRLEQSREDTNPRVTVIKLLNEELDE